MSVPNQKVSDGILSRLIGLNLIGSTVNSQDPMPLLWITAPRNGQELNPGQMLVVGTVKPDASAPVVTVTRDSGEQILSATATPAEQPNSEGWLVWTISVIVEPGAYTVHAVSQVPDGATVRSTVQDKNITVE